MKKARKIILYAVIGIVLVIVGAVSYVSLALPNVGEPEQITIKATPEVLARGKYLATHVIGCMDCHSTRDWTKFGGPVDTNTLGGGGELFDANVGFPGEVHVPNITPYGIGQWTDGELFRAITCGVRKNGNAIFPLMPWPYYSKLDREDIYAMMTYIRNLKPIKADYPTTKLDFPLNIIVHTMPQKAELGKRPDPHDTVKYGAYLVNACACAECHTQHDNGTPVKGMDFAGGREFKMGNSTIRSANITQDKETGIGTWTKEAFLARFKMYADGKAAVKLNPGDAQTVMPWFAFSGMTDGDLNAIYAYIKTLKPVKNKVTHFSKG